MIDRKYYSFKGIFSSPVSWRIRKRIYNIFMEKMKPNESTYIIDVGVTCDDIHIEDNYFEKLYPYKDKIVGVGIDSALFLEKKYPGFRFVLCDATALPFRDKTFDIAISSALIEHVGSHEKQTKVISEILRVSKKIFITTPYKYCPVELHTNLPLLHFLPERIYRKILILIGMTFWADEQNLNLLSKKSFLSLFPEKLKVEILPIKIINIFTTNFIAIVR